MVVAACEAQGVQPVFHTVVQTYQIARSLVEAGAGMAVVDPFTAASARRQGAAPPVGAGDPVQLYLLTRATRRCRTARANWPTASARPRALSG
jgi:DNA-binding transcriptional LysR family regulator